MKTKTKTYRLVSELIPEPLWGVSAYRVFGKTKPWKEMPGHACECRQPMRVV